MTDNMAILLVTVLDSSDLAGFSHFAGCTNYQIQDRHGNKQVEESCSHLLIFLSHIYFALLLRWSGSYLKQKQSKSSFLPISELRSDFVVWPHSRVCTFFFFFFNLTTLCIKSPVLTNFITVGLYFYF